MGEGFEVLIWLGVMAFIGLRSAMQRSQREAQKRRAEAAEMEPVGSVEASSRSAGSAARSRSTGSVEARSRSARSVPAKRKSGVLDRWTEFAAELERQIQAAQAEGRERLDDDDEETLVVPGRRVYPSRETERAVARSEPSHWDDWETDPDSHGLHTRGGEQRRHMPAPRQPRPVVRSEVESVERRVSPGLARLDGYSSLKRAVLLSEILGPPPGLDGVSPAERRLDEIG